MKVLAYSGIENAKKHWPEAEIVQDNPPIHDEYDAIYFEHLLQQLPRKDALPSLILLYNCLKPGGSAIIITTDAQWAGRELSRNDNPSLVSYMALYGDDNEPYQSGWTLVWLRRACEEVGFITDSAYATSFRANVSGEEIVTQSLVYEGHKPGAGDPAEAIE